MVGDRAVSIFVAPPSMEELEARLRGRGTETEDRILARLGNAAREMEQQGVLWAFKGGWGCGDGAWKRLKASL